MVVLPAGLEVDRLEEIVVYDAPLSVNSTSSQHTIASLGVDG